MLPLTRARLPIPSILRTQIQLSRPFSSQPSKNDTSTIPARATNETNEALEESPDRLLPAQAPNRASTWAKSQRARSDAMTGPLFEQTVIEYQPQPYAAIELVHKQPVTWTKDRVVSCNGGGGPLGHPRIFINVDKPKICWCTYCGLPFAHEHHKSYLESLPSSTYPLSATGDAAEANPITRDPLEQR
ncbi:MAG: hypothetical protein M1829_006130 [Trizodia sp. TS-e1964]|nr:MAG: hypothetical protein M1829_006130 [Trizodia sp. TS-e1964]